MPAALKRAAKIVHNLVIIKAGDEYKHFSALCAFVRHLEFSFKKVKKKTTKQKTTNQTPKN